MQWIDLSETVQATATDLTARLARGAASTYEGEVHGAYQDALLQVAEASQGDQRVVTDFANSLYQILARYEGRSSDGKLQAIAAVNANDWVSRHVTAGCNIERIVAAVSKLATAHASSLHAQPEYVPDPARLQLALEFQWTTPH